MERRITACLGLIAASFIISAAKADLVNTGRTPVQGLYPKGLTGQCLQMSGSDVTWGSCGSGGSGTVTSVAISGTNGMLSTGGPITTSGTIDIALDQGQVLVPSAIGSTVQAWDTHLDDIAAITPGAENRIIVADGLGGWSVASFSSLDTNTNASTICSGSTTYLDGNGGCDDISSVYQAASANLTTLASNDGSNLTGVDAATLDTVDSTSFLRSDANDTFSAATLTIDGNGAFNQSVYFDTEYDDGNSSTADTIDWRLGNHHKSTLTGNCTYTFTAPAGATTITLKLVQDATGSRTATWPATVKWPGGTAPTLTTTASAVDFISCYYDGTNYYCSEGLDFK